ncbi:ATP-binding protein [Qipengyuania sp. JC766]|uniref:sensor histidine kinase n=1 Tax=Qipengyuania sp. JC766 TaxID=3232139 RepID=UPI003458179B
MELAALTPEHHTPRWRRRFAVAAKRANLFGILEIASGVAFVVMAIAAWYAFSSYPAEGQLLPSGQVATLLIGTLIPAMALLVLLGRRIALRRAAGSTARLHVRLVFFFSLVAAIPTLLVAGFAAFLFQSGVDFWFSDDARGLMRNADEFSRSYYEDNQNDLAEQTVAMASDLRYTLVNSGQTAFNDPDFVEWLATIQFGGRSISESAILVATDGGSMQTLALYDISPESEPAEFGTANKSRLDAGERAVVEGDEARIQALSAIDREQGLYLYNVRNLQALEFDTWVRVRDMSSSYQMLVDRARALQLRFNLALFFVSLALVGLAVWFALRFADRQVEPLTDLVLAARQVGSGNFSLRVAGRTGADEIGLLNRAFNRMTAQIEKQTDALLGANEQLEERRAFVEALLESISAGIVSTDRDGNILLMNSSAKTFLNPGEKSTLEKIQPQIAELLRSGDMAGIVQHERDGELLTLAVKIAQTDEGWVITFEDITRQLLDQRQAAWSDVARRIAHEIKNPLTPIQLATERLKRRYAKEIETDPALFNELTSTIVRQVGTLRKMVDEFSSFARIPKPVFRQEDMVDLVRQAMFLQDVAHPGVEFELTGDVTSTANVACDRHQVGQALTNVLKNAVEAIEAREARDGSMEFSGRVLLRFAMEDRFARIDVEDNGIGLPNKGERIVEPYVTTREKGTGLGLAIVKKIVEEHGGDMNFADAGEGGTRVTLRFAREPESDEGGA